MPAKLEHLAIDQLAATPEILRMLMAGMTEEQATWKPAPDRWSVAEVIAHLSHIEGHGFRVRIDQILAEDNPEVVPYEQDEYAAAGLYAGKDPEETFAHWEEQREEALEALRDLETADLERTATHPTLGRFTLDQMLHEWAFHDLSHIRQITELVKAAVYFPNIGPWQQEYAPKP